jgi:hypothetical protein
MTSFIITNSSNDSGYKTKINNTQYDLFSIFANNSTYLTTPPFITNFNAKVNSVGSEYDLSQLFVVYSTYLSTPPFVTGFNTNISGTTYDLSQIFVAYILNNISGSFNLYYNPSSLNYYINLPNSSSSYSFDFILNSNVTGYIVGGGGGGSCGGNNPSGKDPKGGSGGGGGATCYLSFSAIYSNTIQMTIGSGGLARPAPVSSNSQSYSDGEDSTLTYDGTIYSAGFGYGGYGTYPGNNQNPSLLGSNGGVATITINSGSPVIQTYGYGGSGSNGYDAAGLDTTPTAGGGGGGAAIDEYNLSYSNTANGSASTPPTSYNVVGTGGSYNGGSGGYAPSSTSANAGSYGAGGGGGSATNNTPSSGSQSGAAGGAGYGLIIFSIA